MLARYLQYVERAKEPTLVRASATGQVVGNAAAQPLIGDPTAALIAAFDDAAAGKMAIVRRFGSLALAFVPLFDGMDGSVEAVLAVSEPLEALPRVFHDVHGAGHHFANVVHLVPQVVLTARPTGTIDFLSRQWSGTLGMRRPIGDVHARFFEAVVDEDRRVVWTDWLRAIKDGAPFTLRLRLKVPSAARWFEVSAVPWRRSGPRIVKWVATLSDVDEEVRAAAELARSQARLRLLAELSTALAACVDIADLAEAAAPLLATWSGATCIIEVREDEARLAYAAAPADGRLLVERIATALETAHGRDGLRAISDLYVRQLVGPRLGGFVALSGAGEPADSVADLDVLDDVIERIVVSAERVLATRRERRVSEVLQRAMLPVALPSFSNLAFDVAYRAADSRSLVGGDWYDAFALPDGRIALSIGDVAGHGLDAAIAMGRIRQTIRTSALANPDPCAVLQYASAVAHLERSPLVTAFYGVLDPLTLTLDYASAGHPPPLVVDACSVRALAMDGPPLGVEASNGRRETRTERLATGAALMLYTDGVVELDRDYVVGERRLVDLAGTWGECGYPHSAEELHATLLGRRRQDDDAALFIVRTLAADELDVTIPATLHDAQRARRGVQRFVRDHDVDADRAAEVVLAVAEAINNAAEHAYRGEAGTVRVELRWEPTEIVALVTDRGSWRTEVVSGGERGRGILLMQSLAASVAVERESPGTRVCLRFGLPPAVAVAAFGSARD